MSFSTGLCKSLNRLFPLPVHPFNLQNDGVKTYAQWQFEKAENTIKFYLEKVSTQDMFKDKVVLDVGCGAGGKTLYYAAQGVRKVYGLDVVEHYREESNSLAREKGLSHLFEFVLGDAAALDFEEGYFDTIIMNDAMEHVDDPAAVLRECYRVLKPGGKLYVNFPPYYHPHGAHLSDAIGFPWVHMFFSDKTLIQVYKDLLKDTPDGADRINFRISKDKNGQEYFSYINRMTIKWFNRLLKNSGFAANYYKEVPLRGFLSPLCKIPFARECFVKMVVSILEKPRI